MSNTQKPAATWQPANVNLGPIQRYAADLAEVEFGVELDKTSCVVSGSYAIQMIAQVVLGDGSTKSFSLGYIKRYNAERLAAQMRGEGWELLQRWSYGSNYAMVCLFRKVEALREGRPRAGAGAIGVGG